MQILRLVLFMKTLLLLGSSKIMAEEVANKLSLGGAKLGVSVLDQGSFIVVYAISSIVLIASLYFVHLMWKDRK